MKQTNKRIFSLLLALIMVLTMLPSAALAIQPDPVKPARQSNSPRQSATLPPVRRPSSS